MSKSHNNKISSQQQHDQKVQIRERYIEMYQGALPRPQDFAEFEKVLPGAADRIVSMAEKEQGFRHKYDQDEMKIVGKLISRSQLYAFILGVIGIGGGVYLLAIDKDIAGFTTFLSSLGSLLGIFLWNKKNDNKSKTNIPENL